MSTPEVLSDLLARGIQLWRDGDLLRYLAPMGTLTEADRVSIRVHKAELLAALAAQTVQAARSLPAPMSTIPPHVACSTCAHLDGGRCTKWGFYPIFPHLAMRLCGAYEVRP